MATDTAEDLKTTRTDPSAAPASLDQFLAGISARAFRFAELGLRHRDDALDAVQDAMARMLGYRDRPAAEWTPLFWSVLRSRIVDAQRRRMFSLRWLVPTQGGDGAIDWSEEEHPGEYDDPMRHQHGHEAWTRIAAALRSLPARQREAFTLRVFEELDVATTASVMGCSEGAVKTHLSRARESLQQQLEEFR
ncbi:MAG TPA: RNA polymerase sigma factor [Lysobacter sp.]|jgi:RNA polymerase sigma-70 factor (ECF subfamily)|nr:RNA polymerase sigma factor [Lysobacter sp.]